MVECMMVIGIDGLALPVIRILVIARKEILYYSVD
jgi:hypothetical protein